MMKTVYCYCGCHRDQPVPGTHVEAGIWNPICLECLTAALNEHDEVVCSRSPQYEADREDWRYYTALELIETGHAAPRRWEMKLREVAR